MFDVTLSLAQIGKGRILVEGFQVAILGYGSIVQNCVAAQISLLQHGVSVTVADARFCKPLDRDLIRKLVRDHEILITIEEGAIGGFSTHVAHFLSLEGLLDGGLKVSLQFQTLCLDCIATLRDHGFGIVCKGKTTTVICSVTAFIVHRSKTWFLGDNLAVAPDGSSRQVH